MTPPNPAVDTTLANPQLAYLDQLTGLFNRRVYFLRGENAVSRARRGGHELSLLLVNVDHLAAVNHQHGLAAGDTVLRGLAEQLRGASRERDMVARVAGDAFALLCPDLPLADALSMADGLCQTVARSPYTCGDKSIALTISIGVVLFDAASDNGIEDLMRRADLKLSAAKKSGRNRVAS